METKRYIRKPELSPRGLFSKIPKPDPKNSETVFLQNDNLLKGIGKVYALLKEKLLKVLRALNDGSYNKIQRIFILVEKKYSETLALSFSAWKKNFNRSDNILAGMKILEKQNKKRDIAQKN